MISLRGIHTLPQCHEFSYKTDEISQIHEVWPMLARTVRRSFAKELSREVRQKSYARAIQKHKKNSNAASGSLDVLWALYGYSLWVFSVSILS